MEKLQQLKEELDVAASPERAEKCASFFKTGKGEYGEGDIFIGVTNPVLRSLAKKYTTSLSLSDCQTLLYSPIHEHRAVALFIITHKYQKGDANTKETVYLFYTKHIGQVNNWDLVDLSAHKIAGDYLYDKDRSILYEWAASDNLWIKRVAILTTFAFIKKGDFDDALTIAQQYLSHPHDLIHKATGWMLREIGKKDFDTEFAFLCEWYKQMPRTMLRYAIEKFPEDIRQQFLKGTV